MAAGLHRAMTSISRIAFRLPRAEQTGIVLFALARTVFIIGMAYVILTPILVRLPMLIMPIEDVFDQTVLWIPRSITLQNLRYAVESIHFWEAGRNSFLLSLLVSSLQVVSCTIIGYGFARFRFLGSGFFFALVILTLIIPPQVLMVPTYLTFRFFNLFGLLGESGVNLLRSYWPFVLTSITGVGYRNGFLIYISRQFFKNMPRDLEEAAYVDGAGAFKTFVSVMLPGVGTMVVVVFLFAFMWQWNDVFFTHLYLHPRSQHLILTLENYSSGSSGELAMLEASGILDHRADAARAGLVANIGQLLFYSPLIVLYLLMQRFFIQSIERTGLIG